MVMIYPPALEQTASQPTANSNASLLFFVPVPFSADDILMFLKECVPVILCPTETENTDLISAPNRLEPSAKLLSWSVKTRVVSGLILWCLFCRSAVRKLVSCMISDVVILILVRSCSGPWCSTSQEIQQIDSSVSPVTLTCETWMFLVLQQDIAPRKWQYS